MRFTFTIREADPAGAAGADKVWEVVIEGGGKSWRRAMVTRPDGQGGLLPFPSPDTLAQGEPAPAGLCAKSPADVLRVYKEIVARKAGSIADYGRYMFDNLLGPVVWGEVVETAKSGGEGLVELALSWPLTEGNFSRLHWEMLYDGSNFLTAGHLTDGKKIIDVAITRVVPGTTAVAEPVRPLPRILFVIGTSMSNPTIRPGAEVMGLLRDPEAEARLNARVLENATPKLVAREVADHNPEVVHFICHGEVDARTKAGYIEMLPDQGDDRTQFFAENLWQWLSEAGHPPQIVVLSACQSGTALGPHAVAPLAAELVNQGVPVVIAMSGRVSDLACRLFTRRFGQALLTGETLVAATAKGRRAALAEGDAPKRSVDWGFPTLYLSAAVSPDYAPGEKAAVCQGIERRIRPYQMRQGQPVFCGRQEFFEAYYELFKSNSSRPVLAAYTESDAEGFGRTRLLEMLTAQAIRDGHVPCAVLANSTEWQPPKSPLQFALALNAAMETARSSLGLKTDVEGPIMLLQSFNNKLLKREELPQKLQTALRLSGSVEEVKPKVIAVAIETQFAELMEEARRDAPELVGSDSRAVVLLDELHNYFKDFDSIATHLRPGAWGFGSEKEPVPVVMAFSMNTIAADLLKPIVERQRAGWHPLPLRSFERDPKRPEDMMAYARVLMNPFDKTLIPELSDRAWVMDYDDVLKETVDECVTNYRQFLTGKPIEVTQSVFYAVSKMARQQGFLKPATDADELRKLLEENA